MVNVFVLRNVNAAEGKTPPAQFTHEGQAAFGAVIPSGSREGAFLSIHKGIRASGFGFFASVRCSPILVAVILASGCAKENTAPTTPTNPSEPAKTGKVWVAASCSESDVQRAIDSARSGETVTVPGGDCAWSRAIVVSRSIRIVGKTTTSRDSVTYQIAIGKSDSTHIHDKGFDLRSDSVRISGFTFSSSGYFVGFPSGMTCVRIDHCNFRSGQRLFNPKGTPPTGVLFDNNYFRNPHKEMFYINGEGNNSFFVIGGSGGSSHPEKTAWLEDNAFIYDSTGFNGVDPFDAGEGGRGTYRHNLISFCAGVSPGPMFETHGHCFVERDGYDNVGAYFMEFSNNKVYKMEQGNMGSIMAKIRGGRNLIYNNQLYGSGWGFALFWIQEVTTNCGTCNVQAHIYNGLHAAGYTPPSSTYPLPFQPNNCYIWGNAWDKGPLSVSIYSTDSAYFMLNRDYWTDLYGSNFAYGTFVNRPPTCVTNDCYWATDTNTLYRCESTGSWTLVYQAYSYPHPARTRGSLSDRSAP